MDITFRSPLLFRVGWRVWWRDHIRRLHPVDQGVVALRQNRVYVFPTWRGFGFLFTVALMLLTSLNYAISLGFIITFLWFGVIAATLAQTFRNMWGLQVAPISAGHVFAGGQITFTVMLESGKENRERLILLLEDGDAEIISLSSGQTHSVTLRRTTQQRGYLPMGRMKIFTEAPLGLWRAWSYVHFPLRGLVFPAPEVLPPLLPYGTDRKEGAQSGNVGSDDLAGLREYQYGDPIQRVAWKAVARGAGWFSKAFEGGQGQQHIVLDFSRLPIAMDIEARLSRLTAWVLLCDRENRPFSLILPMASLPLSKGIVHTDEALTLLALFPGYVGNGREQ
ncbi:MAG: DUF58 domain-containing protein [Burkholderiales bacterium]|jgi:uncharacterized protein (DUF58 family)|nr:DUF58 domain-containing protein [Burkholderiales bacterium]